MPSRLITIVGPSAVPRPAGKIGDDEERVWREALKVTTAAGVSRMNVSLHNRGLTNEQAVNFCTYLLKHVDVLRKHSGTKRVVLNQLDMSENQLDDDGVERMLSTLGEDLSNSIGILKLHKNNLTAPGPFMKLLASTRELSELHLSHNNFDLRAVEEIVAGAVLATDGDGGWKYPRNKWTPLWLRVEQQRCAKKSHDEEALSTEMISRIAKEGRPLLRNVCVVDGKTWCCPQSCRCFAWPPAVHLTYIGVPSRNGAKGGEPIAAGNGKESPAQRKEEAPKPPTQAPWRRDIGGAERPDETFLGGLVLDAEQFPALGTIAKQSHHHAELAPGRRTPMRWRKGLLHKQEATVVDSTAVGAIGADDFPALCAIEEAPCNKAKSKTGWSRSESTNVQTTPELPWSLQPFAPAQPAPCKIVTTCYRAETPYCLTLSSGDVVSFDEGSQMMVGTAAYVYGQNLKTLDQGWFPTHVH